MNPLLEISNLKVICKGFSGPFEALKGISLKVYPGRTTSIVGQSGSGKSLTALSIGRLLPSPRVMITEGTIDFLGQNLLEKSEKEMQRIRGKEIGMIFQNPMTSLNPTMPIGIQLMEGLRKHLRLSWKECRREALELLKQVEISNGEERLSQYPHQFSGGMLQRVMIAIAIGCRPKLLIADEPTTALDVTIQAQILSLLKDIQERTGIAILLISHDLAIVAEMSHHVAVMHNGSIVECGPAERIFSQPEHSHTKALLESKRKLYDGFFKN